MRWHWRWQTQLVRRASNALTTFIVGLQRMALLGGDEIGAFDPNGDNVRWINDSTITGDGTSEQRARKRSLFAGQTALLRIRWAADGPSVGRTDSPRAIFRRHGDQCLTIRRRRLY